jgi:hypothetical protein
VVVLSIQQALSTLMCQQQACYDSGGGGGGGGGGGMATAPSDSPNGAAAYLGGDLGGGGGSNASFMSHRVHAEAMASMAAMASLHQRRGSTRSYSSSDAEGASSPKVSKLWQPFNDG